MNILWLINVPLPEASILLEEPSLPFGGWLVNTSKKLSYETNIELSIAFPKKGNIKKLQGEKNKFYLFPPVNETNSDMIDNNKFLEEIVDDANPDIVHIFGTEYAHTLAMVNICKSKNIKSVISIQGLVSVIAKHYMMGLPTKVQKKITFRDLIKRDNIKLQQKKFVEKGKLEIEAIQKVGHVIGRTTWDKACTSQINPNAKYHFCNETLRDEFYKHIWNKDNYEKHSIFVSQGSYPIKGLHYILQAMPLVLKKFPKAKLYVGGLDITSSKSYKEKIKMTSYGYYINELIEKNSLHSNVFFTGILNEEQMCNRFLLSNVFVSPSSIENESNSLSEAKLLGVPSVASYVGGVTDRIHDKEDGFFYQNDSPYMLAYYICEIFKDEELALKFSKNARKQALSIFDSEVNIQRLIEIYNNIFKENH